ncbi:MAG TPA: hypothetical protein VN963_09000 [bacterium]|nr:hypothetical protein [bacterium]
MFLPVLIVLNGVVHAGNAALSQSSTVPAGERIANYLQAVMSSAGEVVTARSPGDIFSPKDPFQLAFNYDPEAQVIDVYITGKLEKAEDIKPIFDLTQKLVLRLNDKIQKFYGVTLQVEDLSVDYLNVDSGKVIMKLVNGQFVDKTSSEAVSTPTISSNKTTN